jgi:hypothetical protein
MGRLNASLLALFLAAAAALGLVACGSSGSADLLPGKTAGEITENLDAVKGLAGEGECIGAENEAQEVSNQIDALGGVDKQLKQALMEGAERLTQVVESCEEAPEEEATSPAIEAEEEVETESKGEKVGKAEKQEKTRAPKEPKAPPAETSPELPPQSNGKGEGSESGSAEAPATEEGAVAPSGGVGPAAPAEGE